MQGDVEPAIFNSLRTAYAMRVAPAAPSGGEIAGRVAAHAVVSAQPLDPPLHRPAGDPFAARVAFANQVLAEHVPARGDQRMCLCGWPVESCRVAALAARFGLR